MRAVGYALYRIAITVWVGGLLVVGGLVVPTLFYRLTDRALAGNLAGTMFTSLAWIGIVCSVYIVLFLCARHGVRVFSLGAFWLTLLMLALTLVGLLGIQPIMARLTGETWPKSVMESALRDRFAMWHGISSALYVAQALLGLALVLVHDKSRR